MKASQEIYASTAAKQSKGPLAVGLVHGGTAAEVAAPVAPASPALGSDQEFIGMVKSYNERRGFGFVACAETAQKFGRDVYIAKTEAAQVVAESLDGRPPVQATLAEEDFIRFHVRLSVEGFPQAERIRRIRKFQGRMVQPPALIAEGNEESASGRIASDEVRSAFGQHEVRIDRVACGQARLAVGDRVAFCLKDYSTSTPQMCREARLIVLTSRPQQNAGLVLGCFALQLPRAPLAEGWPARADMKLDCHALGDRVILSGLPPDADEPELMRFFVKQAATSVTLAQSQSGAFAAASFPGISEVARFVARDIHTFADDKETRLAKLVMQTCCGEASRLPGLPAPALAGGDENGSLVVTWSPVVLATGYCVELRPAGVQAEWSMVDVTKGQLGGDNSSRFARECSSCKVAGLASNIVFEARVTYYTSCGCRADTSDASDWCLAVPSAVPASRSFSNMGAQRLLQAGVPMHPYGFAAGTHPKAPMWFNGMPQAVPGAEAWAGMWPAQASSLSAAPGVGFPLGDFQQMQPLPTQTPGWRCMHGMVNPPPPMPELRLADEAGFAMLVQWPSVNHATAYVVELRESGSQRVERFMRSVPSQAMGSLVELRIGGLRPSGVPGQCYIAQVRCVAGCGCESEPSPPGWSQPLSGGGAMPLMAAMQQQQQLSTPAPQQQPQGWLQPQQVPMVAQLGSVQLSTKPSTSEADKLGQSPQPLPRGTPPARARSSPEEEQMRLPTLLSPSSRMPLAFSPNMTKADFQDASMEDDADDCIVLD